MGQEWSKSIISLQLQDICLRWSSLLSRLKAISILTVFLVLSFSGSIVVKYYSIKSNYYRLLAYHRIMLIFWFWRYHAIDRCSVNVKLVLIKTDRHKRISTALQRLENEKFSEKTFTFVSMTLSETQTNVSMSLRKLLVGSVSMFL